MRDLFTMAVKNYRNIGGIATQAEAVQPPSLDFRSSSRYVICEIAPRVRDVVGAMQFEIPEVMFFTVPAGR
jgi:hypothetical protein